MHDIICSHCNKAFKIDEAEYADILKRMRDSDFKFGVLPWHSGRFRWLWLMLTDDIVLVTLKFLRPL